MKSAVVVGNPKPASRTLAAATYVAGELSGREADLVVDLATLGARLLDWQDPGVAELIAEVGAADLVVVGSPTYKATYTGLTKAFLDHFSAGSLAAVVAIPVMTGADKTHALGVDTALVPLLTELGAVVVARGTYFVTEDMGTLSEFATAAGRRHASAIRTVARLAASTEVTP